MNFFLGVFEMRAVSLLCPRYVRSVDAGVIKPPRASIIFHIDLMIKWTFERFPRAKASNPSSIFDVLGHFLHRRTAMYSYSRVIELLPLTAGFMTQLP